jgi:hypothetical protein
MSEGRERKKSHQPVTGAQRRWTRSGRRRGINASTTIASRTHLVLSLMLLAGLGHCVVLLTNATAPRELPLNLGIDTLTKKHTNGSATNVE